MTQDYAEAIEQERCTLIKAMKKARALGFHSKVINRHLVVGEERFTCGTIPEHLKESSMETEITTQVNFCLLELCFYPKALFLVFSLKMFNLRMSLSTKTALYSVIYNSKQPKQSLEFNLVCILPLVCSVQSAFYPESPFYPQSAFYTDRFLITADLVYQTKETNIMQLCILLSQITLLLC